MSTGYTGISFPFRLGNKGGIAMSSTSPLSTPHIEESITQILSTKVGERIMEPQVCCSLSASIFEPTDISSGSLIKYEIVQAISNLDKRVTITEDDITLSEIEENGVTYISVELEYTVNSYVNTSHTVNVKVEVE